MFRDDFRVPLDFGQGEVVILEQVLELFAHLGVLVPHVGVEGKRVVGSCVDEPVSKVDSFIWSTLVEGGGVCTVEFEKVVLRETVVVEPGERHAVDMVDVQESLDDYFEKR